jgi:hypothetical protein
MWQRETLKWRESKKQGEVAIEESGGKIADYFLYGKEINGIRP